MAKPHDDSDKAPSDFETRLGSLEAERAEKASGTTGTSLNEGYRLVAGLVSGVLVGIGLGWLLDHFAHTTPWGLVGGLLIGFGVSTYSTVRAAGRISNQAEKGLPPQAVPVDDDDDD